MYLPTSAKTRSSVQIQIPCDTISDHDAPYIIVNIPTNKYEIHYKFIRNLKHFNLETYINDFKTLPFATVYSFNEADDQLDTLNKLILSVIDKHAPLVKTKFTKPPAPWMKDTKINNLQRQRDHWRHEAHKNLTDENWENYRESRNKIKKAIKEKKTQFYRKVNKPTELKDYRPISILPILSKVYEKQVLHQITDFIETQQVYNKHQSGYRKNHSTATILSKLYDDIKMTMKQSELTMAVFTNYSKAFDTIYTFLH